MRVHDRVGAALVQLWGLPLKRSASVVAVHHKMDDARTAQPLVAVLQIAEGGGDQVGDLPLSAEQRRGAQLRAAHQRGASASPAHARVPGSGCAGDRARCRRDAARARSELGRLLQEQVAKHPPAQGEAGGITQASLAGLLGRHSTRRSTSPAIEARMKRILPALLVAAAMVLAACSSSSTSSSATTGIAIIPTGTSSGGPGTTTGSSSGGIGGNRGTSTGTAIGATIHRRVDGQRRRNHERQLHRLALQSDRLDPGLLRSGHPGSGRNGNHSRDLEPPVELHAQQRRRQRRPALYCLPPRRHRGSRAIPAMRSWSTTPPRPRPSSPRLPARR